MKQLVMEQIQNIIDNLDFEGPQHIRLKRNQQLYELLFAPLAPSLNEIDRVVIIPDQAIGLLSFDALIPRIPENWDRSYQQLPYLIDRFQFRYQLSLNDLAKASNQAQETAITDPQLLVIAPVFDETMSKSDLSTCK